MQITHLTYHNPILITAPKIDTDLLWILTLVFVGLALIYFMSVFFFRNKISSQSSKTGQRKKELSPMISEFLFYEDDVDKAEKSHYIDLKIQIRELLKNDFNRKVLTEILLDLRKDVSGDTKERLFKLYQDLGLEKDAFEKLTSWRWEVISKGISHLTQMQVESAYGFIIKFINHRQGTIRKQAEIATVTLKPEGINYFLDTTRYIISEWQQLKLLDVIRNQEDLDPPRFKMWLTSSNKHVVLFALRLIKYYNQNDANTSLIELVKHKNNQIKAEALGCIKEFNVVEAIPTLKQVFSKCSTDIKIAILGTIGDLGNTSDISFLQGISKREGNFSVKSKALAAINMIAPETILPTKGIEKISENLQFNMDFEENQENISGEEITTQITNNQLINQDINPWGANREIIENEKDLQDVQDESKLQLDVEEVSENSKKEQVVNEKAEVVVDETMETQPNEDRLAIQNSASGDSKDEIVSYEPDRILAEERQNIHEDTLKIDGETVFNSVEKISTQKELVHDTELRNTSKNTKEVNTLHLDFIPIVVDNKPKSDRILEKYRPMANSKNPDIALKEIEVDFEEVVMTKADIEKKPGTGHFDISEINFLPVVVDSNQNDVETNEMSPMDMNVLYEEIHHVPVDDELPSMITEINEMDFLPIVTDGEIECNNETEEYIEPEKVDTLNNIDGYTLSDFEVSFEETSVTLNEQTVEFDLDNPPIIDVEGSAVEDVMSWLMAHNELREIELQYEIVSADKDYGTMAELIPEPIYYDEHEAYMMGLLDDLEELGDSREIPFLEELIAVEKKSFIKDRITNLITRFSLQTDGQTIIKKNYEQKADLPVFSVFADLFKNIDTESKLILLDEIVAVGDGKEIAFLDGLLEDPHPAIRKKAQEALKLLVAKMSDSDMIDENKKKQEVEELPTRVFDCHTSAEYSKEGAKITNRKHLFNNIDISHQSNSEIFEIDFELSEVLDKSYSNKVLNLPVIATEISPNGASLIFQLSHFPNNIIKKFNG